jgi:glycosyltransferase involved in cell wall biosynthesis
VRVLYLLTDGFGLSGGIAQFNRDFLKAICSAPGVEEVLALPRNRGREPESVSARLRYDLRAAGGKLRYAMRLLRHLLLGGRIDLIVCAHLNLQPLALLARRASGAPVVLVLHGIEAWTAPVGVQRRRAAGRADWVAAVSHATLSRFAQWASAPDDRTAILPCCVDTERFVPGPPSAAILRKYDIAGASVLLSLGRLAATERYKGFDELIEVLGRLRGLAPDLLCVIAGGGEDRARLEKKARDLGVLDFVRFTGFVPDEDLVDLYRAARVFVLAGSGEGFGIVLLEAMACGIPVVASTLDGSIEAVRGGVLGAAVDPRDPEALVAAISQALRRGVGERPAGLDYFSYPAFEARAHALLARIAAAPARAHGRSGQPPANRR